MQTRLDQLFATGLLLMGAAPVAGQTQLWIRQFGTVSSDRGLCTAPDGAGGAFVGGETIGNLVGSSSGDKDAWVGRYNSAGTQVWIRQFGTGTEDGAFGMAPDGAGGVYACGSTFGSLGGPNPDPSGLTSDAWVGRFDGAGNQVWTIRQFGTSTYDSAGALAPDGAGGAFVAGSTSGNLAGPHLGSGDTMLARYDSTGSQLWVRQWGTTTSDFWIGAAPDDSGGVYVTGQTNYNAGLARYNASGTQMWIRFLGSAGKTNNPAYAAAADGAGGVFIAGHTTGNLAGPNAGMDDAWVARYNSAGTQLWVRQFGTTWQEGARALASDGSGGVYVGGGTTGELAGKNAGVVGSWDAWLARYDGAGTPAWILQFGAIGSDLAWAGSPDGSGGVVLAGWAEGALGGPPAGGQDVWVGRFSGCYPDCNADTQLTVADFGCFQTRFVAADPYADCNADGQRTVADFGCFQTKFVAGCP